jgi:hypothetical protein
LALDQHKITFFRKSVSLSKWGLSWVRSLVGGDDPATLEEGRGPASQCPEGLYQLSEKIVKINIIK